ncbi:MAG TPA: hypothetical protein VLG40_00150 [Candidatus Saccharimonas sp.]|nr:hypothetical protein [Candidatus Saccharimonas sp.]
MSQKIKRLLLTAFSVLAVGSAGTLALAAGASAHSGNHRMNHNPWQIMSFLQNHSGDILKGGPLVHEHVELTADLLKAQFNNEADVTALTQAEDANATQLADIINNLYPGMHDQFLNLWRQHINYYTDYVNATKAHNSAGQQQAKQHLATFAQQLSDLLGSNSWWLDSDKLQQQLTDHVNGTTSLVDSLAAGNYADFYAKVHTGFEHATELSTTLLAGANFWQ